MADLLAAALVVCFEASYQVLQPFCFTFGLDRMKSIFIPLMDRCRRLFARRMYVLLLGSGWSEGKMSESVPVFA